MDTKDNCKVLLTNGKTQKIKGYKFFQTDIARELVVHEDVEDKKYSSITDVETGYRLCQLSKDIKKVTETDINETLNKFVRHYTIEGIKDKFKEKDNRDKKD